MWPHTQSLVLIQYMTWESNTESVSYHTPVENIFVSLGLSASELGVISELSGRKCKVLQHFKEKIEDSNKYSKYRCSLIQSSPELAQLTFWTRSLFEVRVCPVHCGMLTASLTFIEASICHSHKRFWTLLDVPLEMKSSIVRARIWISLSYGFVVLIY